MILTSLHSTTVVVTRLRHECQPTLRGSAPNGVVVTYLQARQQCTYVDRVSAAAAMPSSNSGNIGVSSPSPRVSSKYPRHLKMAVASSGHHPSAMICDAASAGSTSLLSRYPCVNKASSPAAACGMDQLGVGRFEPHVGMCVCVCVCVCVCMCVCVWERTAILPMARHRFTTMSCVLLCSARYNRIALFDKSPPGVVMAARK